MNIPNTTKRHGFGLIEVTISTLLVSLLLIGSLTAIGSLEKSREIDCESCIATSIANKVLTEILANSFSDIAESTPAENSEGGGILSRIVGAIVEAIANRNNSGDTSEWTVEYSVDYMLDDLVTTSDTETGIKRVEVRAKRHDVLVKTVHGFATSKLD